MAVGKPSEKRLLINQANSRIVAVTTAASFIVVFCLVASYTLVGELAYQNRVLGKKKAALSQLKTDINSVQTLETSYTAFVQTPQNVLGGNTHGQGGMDGDNAKIVLDALPSKYDFPALATGYRYSAVATRMTRSALLEVLREVTPRVPATTNLMVSSATKSMDYFDWAKRVVDQLRGAHPVLESAFDAAYGNRRV